MHTQWEWGEPWTIIGASIGVGSTTTGNGGELRIREAVRGAAGTGVGITATKTRPLAVGTPGIEEGTMIAVACPSATTGCNPGSGMVGATT